MLIMLTGEHTGGSVPLCHHLEYVNEIIGRAFLKVISHWDVYPSIHKMTANHINISHVT